MSKTKLVAFDLDGTLTQHKSPLGAENRRILDRLGEKYRLMMVGAGGCRRIFEQMGHYPLDIIGFYGMQYARYDKSLGDLCLVRDVKVPCDRESVDRRITGLRQRFGYESYTGENVEFHPSGALTFPLLGTGADLARKLAFDPDRSRRRVLYPAVKEAFPDYTVFIGGSSSFDLVPRPYNKYWALDEHCRQTGLLHEEIAFVGDDYHTGGNDEDVYRSDIPFFPVDDYMCLGEAVKALL